MGQYQPGPPQQGYGPPPQQKQPVQIDFQKIMSGFTKGEQVFLVASLLLLIDSFITAWLHVSYDCPSGTPAAFCSSAGGSVASLYNGWGWISALAMFAIIIFFVLRKFLADTVSLPALPVPDAYIYMGAGAVEVLGMLFFWLEYKESAGFSSISFGWAWFVGLACAIATIVAGYLKQQDPAPAVAGGT